MSKTAILESARELDLPRARTLAKGDRALLAVRDRQGRGLLHIAASVEAKSAAKSRSQLKYVDWLLDEGAQIDEQIGKDRCTALFFAVARARSTRLAARLIERGASVHRAPGQCMFAAGWWDDPKSLRLLLDAGADVDVELGMTPFLASWCWQRFRAAKFLVMNGADVNYHDDKGRTALHHAIEKEFDPGLIKWLVERGASPDIRDRGGVTVRERASRKRDKRYATAIGE